MDSVSSMAPPLINRITRRIVITTWGSFGDLHPYVALALGLKSRGYEAILATGECYRQKIEALGLGFRPVRPDCDWVTDPVEMRRLMHQRWGVIRVVRTQLLSMRASYEDMLAAAQGCNLIVGNMPTLRSHNSSRVSQQSSTTEELALLGKSCDQVVLLW